MKYTILLQNNASKEFFILSGLNNTSTTELYLQFEEVDMPEGVQDGEYTYAVIRNDREDVRYSPRTPILDTIVSTVDGDIVLKDLCPLTGLLRVGNITQSNQYDDGKNKTFYYEG